ncbi:MAG: hypothetical protein ACM3XM_19890 [Mycobacterium leprae]
MKRKINWAIPGLLGIVLFIAAMVFMQRGATALTNPTAAASECAACHNMEQQVSSWEHSAHKDAACTTCHTDPGVKGWLEVKLGERQMKAALDKGSAEGQVTAITKEVPNERCISCHAKQMPWVMQDLQPPKLDGNGEPVRVANSALEFLPGIAGHDVHLTAEQPLKCVDCHFDATHGPADKAQQVADMHQACLDCHAKEKVALTVKNTVSCSACHNDLAKVAPDDHKNNAFRESHGKIAATQPETCQNCHLNPGLGAKAADSGTTVHPVVQTTVSGAAESQVQFNVQFPPGTLNVPPDMTDACASCHGTTMPHPKDWLKDHATGYQEKPEMCASCHGTTTQGFDMKVTGNPRTLSTTDPTCTSCHAQPMPHPADWLTGGHQNAATAAPQTCDQCHSAKNPAHPNADYASPQYCLNCHLGKYSHPLNWLDQHRFSLQSYGGDQTKAGCTQCHTATTNSCTSCHTNGVGNQQQWHPSDFVATHKDQLASYGDNPTAAGCTSCHTVTGSGFNSCVTCHTNGIESKEWHPAEFIATHKDQLAAVNDDPQAAGCTKCHTTSNTAKTSFNSCTACHTDGLNVATQWHPDNWWIAHAYQVNDSNKASCYSCHDYVQPACTKCHVNKP